MYLERPLYIDGNPQAFGGFFSKTIGWIVGKGNRPGTPESRAGIPSAEEMAALEAQQQGPTIFGIPQNQALIIAGGLAFAYVMLRKK